MEESLREHSSSRKRTGGVPRIYTKQDNSKVFDHCILSLARTSAGPLLRRGSISLCPLNETF